MRCDNSHLDGHVYPNHNNDADHNHDDHLIANDNANNNRCVANRLCDGLEYAMHVVLAISG